MGSVLLTGVCQGSNVSVNTLDVSDNDLSGVDTELLARAVSNMETVNITDTGLNCEQVTLIIKHCLETSSLKELKIDYEILKRINPDIIMKTEGKFVVTHKIRINPKYRGIKL